MFFVHHTQKIPNEGDYVKLCGLNGERHVKDDENPILSEMCHYARGEILAQPKKFLRN